MEYVCVFVRVFLLRVEQHQQVCNFGSSQLMILHANYGNKLTQTHGRWTPRLSVSPARCTGNSGAAGSGRFSGRSARCIWAASPAGWAGLPASLSGSRTRQHLLLWRLTANRLPRCSSSFVRTPHLSSRSLRYGAPAMSSSRARCRLRLRCGSGAWHHQSGHQVRGGIFKHAWPVPGAEPWTNNTLHVRDAVEQGLSWEWNRCQSKARCLPSHFDRPLSSCINVFSSNLQLPPRVKVSTVRSPCAVLSNRTKITSYRHSVCPVELEERYF